jgi:peptidoglycan/LPS O-acetylase OafA/YrhL
MLVRRLSGAGAWTDIHRLALASGALGFFVLLAPLAELDTTRPDNPAGMTVVGVAAALLLVWLGRRTRREIDPASNGLAV